MADQSVWYPGAVQDALDAQQQTVNVPPPDTAAVPIAPGAIGPPSPPATPPVVAPAVTGPPSPIDNTGLQIGGGLTLPTLSGPTPTQMRPGQLRPGEVVIAAPQPGLTAVAAGSGNIVQPPGTLVPTDGLPQLPATPAQNPLYRPPGAGAQDAGFAMGGANGGSPMTWINTAPPGTDEARKKNEEDERRIILQKGETGTQTALAKAEGAGKVGDAEKKAADDARKVHAAEMLRTDPILKQYAQTAFERAHSPMTNPDKRSSFARITDGIFAGLAGLGMGFNHQAGPNPVIERIHNDINREVDRQKTEFANKGASLADDDNIFAHVMRLTHDEALANEVSNQHAIESTKLQAQKIAGLKGSPQDRLDAQLLGKQLDANRLDTEAGEKKLVGGGASLSDKIIKRGQELVNLESKYGPAPTPRQAHRLAVIEYTGKDPNPEDGPLPTVGKTGAGGASAQNAQAVKEAGEIIDRTARPRGDNPGAKGETKWNPLRVLPSSDASKSTEDIDSINSEVKRIMLAKHMISPRAAQDDESIRKGSYRSLFGDPGMTEEQKNRWLARVRQLRGETPIAGDTTPETASPEEP